MSKGSATETRKQFDNRARRLELLVAEGQRLHQRGLVTLRNLDALYESALLDLYTSFELFIEELFFSVLLGRSGISEAGGVVSFASRDQAEAIMLGERNYQVWLPLGKGVEPLSQRLLIDGRPFNRLSRHRQELDTLEELRKVRNAVAHRSSSAQAALSPLVSTLRPGRRHAAGLLQHVQQGNTQHSIYSTTIRRIAAALASTDDDAARALLSPEQPYKPKAKAPKGNYQCTRCQSRIRIRAKVAELPRCVVCKQRQIEGDRGWERIY